MAELDPPASRKRAPSLRTQLFNKRLYERSLHEDIPEQTEHPAPPRQKFLETLKTLWNGNQGASTGNGRDIPLSLHQDPSLLINEATGLPYINNSITSSRYTVFTFFPRQLYAQFSKIANAYFFLVAILQMIPGWSTTGTYTTIIPLCIFMGISMAREAYDDFRRHRLDKEENTRPCEVLQMIDGLYEGDSDKEFNGYRTKTVRWCDVRVGDVVLLHQDANVPADIVLLSSDRPNGETFVETMALDGETNLKAKSPHPKLFERCSDLNSLEVTLTVEDPNNDLYNFEGNVQLGGDVHPLGPDNVVYRGSYIRNTNDVLGVVVFSGEETKIRMNAIKNPRVKAPKLQRMINIIVAFMVLVVACMSLFSLMAERMEHDHHLPNTWYLVNQDAGVAATVMSFIIMFNTLIPLSLYVTIEIIKVMQGQMMQWDIDMYYADSDIPCESRTATILEELGQVQYIFSDKTGTLTCNQMEFKKFTIAGSSWHHKVADHDGVETVSDNEHSLVDKIYKPQRHSVSRRSFVEYHNQTSATYTGRPSLSYMPRPQRTITKDTTTTPELKSSLELILYIQENPETIFAKKAKLFILSLALCHTCLPKRADGEDAIEYQSSSPDELALVTAARDMGFVVLEKNNTVLTLKTYPNGFEREAVLEKYDILEVVEFTSARKRMSTVVRFPDGQLCLFCKGADNIVMERLANSEMAAKKLQQLNAIAANRKQQEAEVVIKHRLSQEIQPRPSIAATRASLDNFLARVASGDHDLEDVVSQTRKSLHYQQQVRYAKDSAAPLAEASSPLGQSTAEYIGSDALLVNEEYVIERTLEAIEEFSTEGLRTLVYSYKWLQPEEYRLWSQKYADAKTSLVNRADRITEVGAQIETGLHLLGATAIEDKLQEGVPEAIEKLRRAGIKLWMLTGDKRETAINIGYSCKLIHDYSSLVVLVGDDTSLASKMTAIQEQIAQDAIAHCVVVIDGATLARFESNPTLMSVFVELCTKTDSVICCRASPSQKALMVSNIRQTNKTMVTLAIGDGANDIAMIQSADIGVGIAGKEGLQASRSADYSIGQFRFLLKLLLVHGRYNYIRTSKLVLCTFYKELMFYLTQMIFQRYTMWSGSSLYEPWSLSVYNTLFTSLPVLCVGIFEMDLRPSTLLAVPELYALGRKAEAFNLWVFVQWMVVAALSSLAVTMLSVEMWGYTSLSDNTLYPMGVLTYTSIVTAVNMKCQFVEMHNKTFFALGSFVVSVGGWLVWVCLLPGLYKDTTSKIYDVKIGFYERFGRDILWWCSAFALLVLPIVFDMLVQTIKNTIWPTESHLFADIEKDDEIRRKLEQHSYMEMRQGWTWAKEGSSLAEEERLVRSRKNTIPSAYELPPGTEAQATVHSANAFETLPSGKVIKKKRRMSRRIFFKEEEEDVDKIIDERLKNLQLR